MSVSSGNTGKIDGVGSDGVVATGTEGESIVTTSSSISPVMSSSWKVNIGSFDVCILFFDAHPFTVVVTSGGIGSTTWPI